MKYLFRVLILVFLVATLVGCATVKSNYCKDWYKTVEKRVLKPPLVGKTKP